MAKCHSGQWTAVDDHWVDKGYQVLWDLCGKRNDQFKYGFGPEARTWWVSNDSLGIVNGHHGNLHDLLNCRIVDGLDQGRCGPQRASHQWRRCYILGPTVGCCWKFFYCLVNNYMANLVPLKGLCWVTAAVTWGKYLHWNIRKHRMVKWALFNKIWTGVDRVRLTGVITRREQRIDGEMSEKNPWIGAIRRYCGDAHMHKRTEFLGYR